MMGRDPRVAAFFDVDGTLLKSNVVEYLAYFQKQLMPHWKWNLWMAGIWTKAPLYLFTDYIDRGLFCRWFYRSYRGLSTRQLETLSVQLFQEIVRPRLYPDAIRQIEMHKNRGDAIVLLTGSLDFIMRPLCDYVGADHLVAAQVGSIDGIFTGSLNTPPLSQAEKAEAVFRLARSHRIDYQRSFAYGDSISDLHMLECVGYPHAVNPDRRLRAIAEKRGWKVLEWRSDR